MIAVIAGTNRPEARSYDVAKIAESFLQEAGEETYFVDLKDLPMSALDGSQYGEGKPQQLVDTLEKMHQCSGYLVVAPEYNGSMPGILKYFIDHWQYPATFENVPVALIGLGGRFGGVRPVEHLQQVFNYRNAYVFPERVFIFNVWDVLKEKKLNEEYTQLIEKQCLGFSRFIKALKDSGLHPR